MSPHNIVFIYKEWVNSVICEEGIQIQSLSQLSSNNLLMRLYQLVTNTKSEADLNLLNPALSSSIQTSESVVSLLRLLRADGIRTNLQPSGQSASHQRTLSIGTKFLLKWCSELLGGACFDYRLSMTENMEKDVLHNIINNVGNLVSDAEEPEPCDYHEAIADAERKLGVSSNLLRVCDSQTENLSVTVYISLLRRKRQLILSGAAPTQPTVLVSQLTQSSTSTLSRSHLLMHNDRTQQVLKDIEKQLCLYQNGFNSSTKLSTRNASALYNTSASAPPGETEQRRSFGDDTHSVGSTSSTIDSANMPSPIARAHGSFPNESHNCLKIDLGQLQQQASSKVSCSASSTPRPQRDDERNIELTTDFAELLRQCKDKEKGERGESCGGGEETPHPRPSQLTDAYIDDEDVDRTSPKSAPNTDEGFGTFTKTTPRGKDSASEGSDDHTDCEVDHLAAETITEWWDRIEMPTGTVSTVDSSMFKQMIGDLSVSRVEESGNIELADDELMCALDSIGMNGVKASSGLASAQETELRLLYILKERDDLVMSYHNALKELSKLTARIKDENHLLRTQLNMTDLSHNEIVLALEEQASDGRQLALSLQDDLTDTEVNVLSRLREDKHVLEDRLAALEHQYNCDMAKWQDELAKNNSKMRSDQIETGEVTRENDMLKLQLDELRNMFDVTMSRTQDECHNYLRTIERLKREIANENAPISESQIESLAKRQAEMEKLYESMISSLEGDNSKLRSDLEGLQEEISKLKIKKETHDISCGSNNACLVSRSMNTSLAQSTKGTETPAPPHTAVKSVCTGEDPRIPELQSQVTRLETISRQNELDKNNLEQQNSSLLENRKELGERLASVQSQLQLSHHKLTTMQAVHELVLSKSESLERSLCEANGKLATEASLNATLKQRISSELERAHSQSQSLNLEVSSLRQRTASLQAECDSYRQREVEMNSELTKLTLERSNLQGKVNTLNSDLVQQKAKHMSQSLQIQRLEVSKAKLESQADAFKRDSLELFKQLEEARQEKDILSQQLCSLHSQLAESMSAWEGRSQREQSTHNQTKSLLESELTSLRSQVAAFQSEKERLSVEADQLRLQLRSATDSANKTKRDLDDLLRTARLDQSSDENVLEQLHEQLKSLQKQSAESRFSMTHFKSENSRLQLRVNQLEEINQATEQRNQILQKELAVVQASLDDSYSSADASLNLRDLSSSDLMSIDDTSELRNYILAAKRQVEMMQNSRAKTNIEYSRKIAEMEKLVKDRSETSSVAPSSSAALSANGSGSVSVATEFVKLPDRVDMNESYSSVMMASSLLLENASKPYQVADYTSHILGPAYNHVSGLSAENRIGKLSAENHIGGLSTENHARPHRNLNPHIQITPTSRLSQSYNAATHSGPSNQKYVSDSHEMGQSYSPTSDLLNTAGVYTSSYPGYLDSVSSMGADIGEAEPSVVPDSLSLRVLSLTNMPGTSTPNHTLSPREPARAGTEHRSAYQGAKFSAIESENAALKAELELINSDRTSLHKHMKDQALQHDVLNTTLDELERSLEEVYDSNRLLKDTLGNCNDFIQTNILADPADTSPTHGHRSASAMGHPARGFVNQSAIRPHSVGPATRLYQSTPRSHSMTPSIRPHSVTPVTRPHSVTPTSRSHGITTNIRPLSVTPGHSVDSDAFSQTISNRVTTTPYTVHFGGHAVNTYAGEDSRVGWSPKSDRHLTSSSEFNKLQQTNVQNYESLLLSDTNSKSPTRPGSMSASKSTDLNHLIQHSLNRLGQVNSLTHESPVLSSSGFASTPLRTSSSSRYDSNLPGSAASNSAAESDLAGSDDYVTARQRNSTPLLSCHTLPLPAATADIQRVINPPYPPSNHSNPMYLSANNSSSMYLSTNHGSPMYLSANHSFPADTSPHCNISRHSASKPVAAAQIAQSKPRRFYSDGGPGPDEPKSVLPEPARIA